ncbi:MAG: cation:proton antiporter, partial [Paludibacteraceae bacterium]|nr:cation:proton antiporter [Paludibacteraceae bacterium]
CLGMVLLATEIGFSAALGAFVMGSLLAETVEAERIEHLTRPVKDFFGAIFFVSVGMMIDPAGIASGWVSILVITAVVIVGQISFGTFGLILSGQPLKVSIQSGFSLAQIGEFAFIIATLGLSLKVIDPHIYPIIVAVSVITTFFTPFFIKSAIPAYNYIHKKMPVHWAKAIQRLTAPPTLINRQSDWYELLKDLIRVMLVYLAITVTIMFVGFIYLIPLLQEWHLGISANIVGALIIIVAMAPFLRAMMIKRNNTIKNFIGNRDISIGPLITIIVGRILLCVFLVMLVLAKLFDLGFLIDALIATATVVLILFSSWIKKGSINIEKRFLTNLTERQIREDNNKPMKKEFVKHLLSRDIHLADFEVQTHSPFVGKQLKELHIREDYGVNIVSIVRGNARIHIPKGNEMIFPYDRIVVAGTDHQMMRFNYRMEECTVNEENVEQNDVVLEQLLLEENSPLIGKTIRSSEIREKYGCMIIGIERPHKYLMNPESSEELKTSDILWLVGEKQKILQLVEQKQ